MLSQETMELVDPFSKPVPGQSLTNDPDNPLNPSQDAEIFIGYYE